MLLAGSSSFAQAPQDEALRSLIRAGVSAGAAAEASQRGAAAAAARLGSVPYDAPVNGNTAMPAEPVPAASIGRPVRLARSDADSQRKGATAVPARGRFSAGYVGLEPESAFELTTARCMSCRAPVEARWYFLDEVIAVPKAGTPSLVWIGSNEFIEGATLSADGGSIRLSDGSVMPLSLMPKIASNKSYYDFTTASFFQNRTLRLRGEIVEEGGARRFIARTIWPEDFRVDFAKLGAEIVKDMEDMTRLVKEDDGGARSAFSAKLLWERDPQAGRSWAGRPVMGLMLNGAQGDDDETHGGHSSYFAGRFGPNGEMSDWLFSNFYDMDEVSEKGILPALIPMDKYMADLNSGQSYYRPTHVLVAVLKDERVALTLQERFKQLYIKYYAHEVKYNRATKSCAGLIIDELRGEGWNIPTTGPSNLLWAGAIALITAIGRGDRQAGKDIFHFMRQEKTRLFPRATFEAAGADLLSLAGASGRALERTLSPFERTLQEDLDAVILVRLPQIPSSRKFGRYPIASSEEYFGRVPLDRSQWQITPTAPRAWPPPH